MINRHLLLVSMLFTVIPSFGQDITRQEADSMVNSLKKTKPGNYRIDLLLNIAHFHISKPGDQEIDLDSAVVYINEAKEICKKVKSPAADGYLLLTESCLIKARGNIEEGKKNAEKAVKILESTTNKFYLGRAYYEFSLYFEQFKDSLQLSKKIELVKLAINAFTGTGDMKYKARGLEMLGRLYYNTNKDERALPILNHALAIYDSINDKRVQGVYMLLGQDYYSRLDYGRALYYMLKALRTANQVNDTTMQVWEINVMLGKIYQDIDRPDIGLAYLNDGLTIAEKYKAEHALYQTSLNISTTCNDLERYDEALKVLEYLPEKYLRSEVPREKGLISMCFFNAYMKLGQYDRVRTYHDTLLKIVDNSLIDDYRRANIYRLIATYYFRVKNYLKARYYLTKGADLGRKLNFESSLIRDMKLWYQLDSAQGNFHSAYDNLLLYKTKMDSVTGVKKTRQFEVLTVEYELDLKEDSIKLKDNDITQLRERNGLQQLNLRQAGLIKNVTIAGIILALVFIGLLYRQYRQKQKTNNVITNKNEQLQHLLTEKEWLLKEIHHRVKNNFQIVMGLLGTQSGYLKNDAAIEAIAGSQRRIHTMSLIHQRLYQTENLSAINMPDYVHELVDYLGDSFNRDNRVLFDLQVANIELDLAHCIPLGLILNEAITNSFKYAFPTGGEGKVTISLKHTSMNHLLLTIDDNGTGLPVGFNLLKSDSMGMNLMRGLSKEIGAEFTITSHGGTKIEISFLYEPEAIPGIITIKNETAQAL